MDTVSIVLACSLAALFICAPVIGRMIEKRVVWPYGPPKPTHSVVDPGGFGMRSIVRAQALGFEFLDWCDDQKGPSYKLSYAILVSPDRGTMAIVGIGTMLRIPMAGVWLHSPMADEQRSFVTVDKQAGYEGDVLGLFKIRVRSGKNFDELWADHREWLSRVQVEQPQRLAPGRELEILQKLFRTRYDLMARAGYIRFIGVDESRWTYTLTGAIKTYLMHWGIALRDKATYINRA